MIPGYDAIPTDEWVYADLRRLQNRRDISRYPDYAFSGRAHTRAEFAQLIERELRTLGETFDKEVQQDPDLLPALNRLIQEFEPELRRRGVSLFQVEARIAALERNLSLGKVVAPFPDVPKDHWAYAAVQALRQVGIIVGYPGGTFHAEQSR